MNTKTKTAPAGITVATGIAAGSWIDLYARGPIVVIGDSTHR